MANLGIFAGGLARGLQNLPDILLALKKANEGQKLRRDVLAKKEEEKAARLTEETALRKDFGFLLGEQMREEDKQSQLRNIVSGSVPLETTVAPPGVETQPSVPATPVPTTPVPGIPPGERRKEALLNVLFSKEIPKKAQDFFFEQLVPQEGKPKKPRSAREIEGLLDLHSRGDRTLQEFLEKRHPDMVPLFRGEVKPKPGGGFSQLNPTVSRQIAAINAAVSVIKGKFSDTKMFGIEIKPNEKRRLDIKIQKLFSLKNLLINRNKPLSLQRMNKEFGITKEEIDKAQETLDIIKHLESQKPPVPTTDANIESFRKLIPKE